MVTLGDREISDLWNPNAQSSLILIRARKYWCMHGEGLFFTPHPQHPEQLLQIEDHEFVGRADGLTPACNVFDFLALHFGSYRQAIDHVIGKYFAYSKRAEVTVPSLEDWEKEWKNNPQARPAPKIVAVDFQSAQQAPAEQVAQPSAAVPVGAS